jgi:hypothetical protein
LDLPGNARKNFLKIKLQILLSPGPNISSIKARFGIQLDVAFEDFAPLAGSQQAPIANEKSAPSAQIPLICMGLLAPGHSAKSGNSMSRS